MPGRRNGAPPAAHTRASLISSLRGMRSGTPTLFLLRPTGQTALTSPATPHGTPILNAQMGFIAKPVKIDMLEIFQLIADDGRSPGGPHPLKARSDQLRYFNPFQPAAAGSGGLAPASSQQQQ